jgi:3alpha(or 20beta)-hydroxysteroid dehydrogenase
MEAIAPLARTPRTPERETEQRYKLTPVMAARSSEKTESEPPPAHDDPSRLEDRVALITGGAGGIGSATARLMVEAGATVVVADLDLDRASAVAVPLGSSAEAVHLDVTDRGSWVALADRMDRTYGRLDVLFNNAGYFTVGPIETIDLDELRRAIDVNQIGPILGISAMLPLLRRSAAGSVVNMSSGSGMAGYANQTAYASSKWAVRGVSRCAAAELAPYGIRVNSVHPGPVNTPMINRGVEGVDQEQLHTNIPIPRWADPIEIARLVLFLASGASSYSTGSEFVADGGMLIGPKL